MRVCYSLDGGAMPTFEVLARIGEDAFIHPDYPTRDSALSAAKAMARTRAMAIGGEVEAMYSKRFGFVVNTPEGEDSSYWVYLNGSG